MADLSQYIEAKSDQLNADDLLGGPRTIRVTRVVETNDKEQPIAVHFDGDNGKPYKPGKSMRRVMVGLWGPNGDDYVGRSMTLYRDPEVTFGKINVGGIRISEMSHLDGNQSLALAVKKGAKKLFNVRPLQVDQRREERPASNGDKPRMTPEQQVDSYVATVGKLDTLDALRDYQADERRARWIDALSRSRADLHERVVAANSEAFKRLSPPDLADEDPPALDGDDFTFDDSFPAEPGGDQ